MSEQYSKFIEEKEKLLSKITWKQFRLMQDEIKSCCERKDGERLETVGRLYNKLAKIQSEINRIVVKTEADAAKGREKLNDLKEQFIIWKNEFSLVFANTNTKKANV